MDSPPVNGLSPKQQLSQMPQAPETKPCTTKTGADNPARRPIGARDISLVAPHGPLQNPESPRRLFFIDSDTDRQTVLEKLRQEAGPRVKQQQLFYISAPSELENQGLLNTLIIFDGDIKQEEGRLFSDGNPLTVAIDLTTMAPGQIASLNELLDTPSRFRGRAIGKKVRLVVLTDDQTGQMIGPDCWRRLKRYRLQDVPATTLAVTDNETLLNQRVPLTGNTEHHQPAIEFFSDDDWREKLFGGLQLNPQGGVEYAEGKLAQMQPGDRLTLKDAPWDNDRFTTALANVFRDGGFEANGQWVSLPDKLQLFRSITSKEAIEARIKNYSSEGAQRDTYVFIRKDSAEILSRTTVLNDEGACVPYNPLEELAKGCSQIVIQDSLPDSQLRLLLHRFEQIDQAKRPRLVDNRSETLGGKDQLFYQSPQEDCGSGISFPEFEVGVEEVSDTLFQEVFLTDKKQQAFMKKDSSLLESLRSENEYTSINIHRHGTENSVNKFLLCMYQNPPFLMVHGRKIIIPNRKAHYQFPDEACTTLKRKGCYKAVKRLPADLTDSLFYIQYLLILQRQVPEPNRLEFKNKGGVTALLKKTDLASNPLSRMYAKRYKGYKNDPQLYGFIKAVIRYGFIRGLITPVMKARIDLPIKQFSCEDLVDDFSRNYRWADKDGLQQWLRNNPAPTREDVVKDFWVLAQYMPMPIYLDREDCLRESIPQLLFDSLAEHLVGAIDNPEEKRALAERLNVNLSNTVGLQYYHGTRLKLLRHWLVANGLDLSYWEILDYFISLVLWDPLDPKSKKLRGIKTILKNTLMRFGKGQGLPHGSEDFAHALVYGERHSPSRQFVRMEKLAQDIMSYSMTLLEGEAGTGKTWMAEMAATMVFEEVFAESKRPDPASIKITIGPHTSYEDLYGRQVLKTRADGSQHTVFEKGPVLLWAENPNPPVLILDEANLGPAHILYPLAEAIEDSPAIWVKGERYPLTNRHRIVMTGNPASYQGRRFDPDFKKKLHVISYPPMDPQLMMRSLIYPGLPPTWDNSLKNHASALILAQLNRYRPMVPEDVLSPRDTKDLLAHIRHGIHYAQSADKNPMSISKVNGLVHRAFEQSLDLSVSEEGQPALAQLKEWRQAQFPPDNSILRGVDDRFALFMNGLKQHRPDVDFATASITALVKQYWLILEKNDGRSGVLVEGPAGWGKDFILTCVLQEWNRQHPHRKVDYQHLNASLNDWDHLVSAVRQAMNKGSIIVVSELNLIPTAYLEGLFNGLLTGDAAPGFKLIATVNPVDFGGREAFSPALKSRCTQIKLPPFSPQDIKGVITRMSSPPLAQWLASRFVALEQALKEKHLPLRPSMADLSQLVPVMSRFGSSQWGALFEGHFALEMRLAQVNLDDLNTPLPEPVRIKTNNNDSASQPVDLAKESGLPSYFLNTDAEENSELKSADLSMPASVYAPKKNGGVDHSLQPEKQPERTTWHSGGSYFSWLGSFTGSAANNEPTIQAQFNLPETCELDSFTAQGRPTTSRTLFSSSAYPENTYRNRLYALDRDQFWTQHLIDPLAEGITLHELPVLKGRRVWPVLSEIAGSFPCSISNQWQPLPGLTAGDRLQSIACREGWQLEVARSHATGQWLVRCPVPMVQGSEPVTIDFTVKPDVTYNQLPDSRIAFEPVPNLISENTRRWLDNHIFRPDPQCDDCASFNELREIKALKQPLAQVKALANWCRAFSCSEDMDGSGAELVLNIIRKKSGVCRHRSRVFSLLAGYFNIPARVVASDCHEYIEFSPDRGGHWYKMDLGGGSGAHTSISGDFSGHSLMQRAISPFVGMSSFLSSLAQNYRFGFNPNQSGHSVAESHNKPPISETEEKHPVEVDSQLRGDDDKLAYPEVPLPSTDEKASLPIEHSAYKLAYKKVQHWLEGVSVEEALPAPETADSPSQTALAQMLAMDQSSSEAVSEKHVKQIKALLETAATGSDIEKRYAHARMLPFLGSRPFALFLQEKPEWISLLDTTLLLNTHKGALAQNRANRLMVLKKLSGHDGFAQSPLCERMHQYLINCEGHYVTADYLNVLEQMKTHSAQQKVNYFYDETLGSNQQWPEGDGNSEETDLSAPGEAKSKILKRLLQQAGTETGWQHTYSSNGLSIPRMMAGEPCFKKTVEGQHKKTRPAVVHLDAAVLHELKKIHLMWKNRQEEDATSLSDSDTRITFHTANRNSPDKSGYKTASEGLVDRFLPESVTAFDSQASSVIPRLGRMPKQRQEAPFEQVLEQFFQWLAEQDTSTEGQWLVTRTCKNEKGDAIEPGSYQTPPKANDIKAITRCDNGQGYKVHLDQSRIRKALKNPFAILVQDKMLHTLFKEWLSLKK